MTVYQRNDLLHLHVQFTLLEDLGHYKNYISKAIEDIAFIHKALAML